MIQPSRFEQGRPMLLAGLRRHHTFAGAAEGIAAQWADFQALDAIPHRPGSAVYGVMCGGDPQTQMMEFMTAAEVSAFDPDAAHLGRMRVPPQHYAVFEHPGDGSTVRETWLAIWNEWLPQSGYTPVHGPEFERHGEGFDARAGRGRIEIWSPVQPPAA